MAERGWRATRFTSVVAATVIALACGTNYAYSAWAPEFATKMKLSSTQSNLIGTFGNLGMYIAGIPVGMLVDNKGPRPLVLAGSVTLGLGYFFQYRAYEGGAGSIALPWLCWFSFMTGVGGCAAFAAAIKTSALNWPDHRGSATAFPLAGFGLSAFFFSMISSTAFPDNTSDLLLLLATLTFAMCFTGFFFLHVVPQGHGYAQVPQLGERSRSEDSTKLKRTQSEEQKYREEGRTHQIGTQAEAPSDSGEETSSLFSRSSDGSEPGDVPFEDGEARRRSDSHSIDARGLAMLRYVKFYQLWILMGLLTGVGIMTINNIGNDARAIWHHYDDSASPEFIQERQMMHVELLSIMSFIGRLVSGVGSDLIVHRLQLSRFWMLTLSSLLFLIAQIFGTQIQNPYTLPILSSLTGLAYGFLFGCYPALVAETFGVHGLSQNWGFMTLAPVISGYVFNLIYGGVYDRHSVILGDGGRDCREGLYCYQAAYFVTMAAAFAGLLVSLWSVRWDWVGRREGAAEKDAGREA